MSYRLQASRVAAIDTETTGVDVFHDRVVEWSFIRANDETITNMINPGVPIPTAAAEVHGITTEIARDEGVSPHDSLTVLARYLDDCVHHAIPVVVYNAAYDLSLLEREFARHDIARPALDWLMVIDPLILDGHLDKYRSGRRTLLATAAHYRVPFDPVTAHGAAADAQAALGVAHAIIAKFPALLALTSQQLNGLQRAAADERAESLERYWTKHGIDYDPIDGRWPIRTPDTDWQPLPQDERDCLTAPLNAHHTDRSF